MLEYDPAGEGKYPTVSADGEAVLQREEESHSVLKAVYIIVPKAKISEQEDPDKLY